MMHSVISIERYWPYAEDEWYKVSTNQQAYAFRAPQPIADDLESYTLKVAWNHNNKALLIVTHQQSGVESLRQEINPWKTRTLGTWHSDPAAPSPAE